MSGLCGGEGEAMARRRLWGGTPKAHWPFPGTRREIIPSWSRPAAGAVPSRGPRASPVALCAAHRPGSAGLAQSWPPPRRWGC